MMRTIVLTTLFLLLHLLVIRGYAITCYCDYGCIATNCTGVVCYARLIIHIDTNTHDFDFGCFAESDIRLGLLKSNSSGVCKGNVYKTGNDTATVYKCCDNSDLCNKDYLPTIPSNLLYVTFTPTPSISPTPTPTTSTTNLWLILLWTVTPIIVIVNIGLFIILIIAILMCCKRRHQVYREQPIDYVDRSMTFT